MGAPRGAHRSAIETTPGVTNRLPEAELFSHLYLYSRDNEDDLIRVAAPRPWDQKLFRTF